MWTCDVDIILLNDRLNQLSDTLSYVDINVVFCQQPKTRFTKQALKHSGISSWRFDILWRLHVPQGLYVSCHGSVCNVENLKGIVYPNLIIPSSFALPYVVSKLYPFLFLFCTAQKKIFCEMSLFFSRWTPMFFRISSFMLPENHTTQGRINDDRMIMLKFPLNIILYLCHFGNQILDDKCKQSNV